MKYTVEICCGSVDDVFAAAAGGADRVELNSAMFLGGLTPSIGTVSLAKKAGIDIFAMVRPRQGGFCYTDREFDTMLADTDALLEAGVDGLVFGILDADGNVDAKRCEKLLKLAGNTPCVFHRAIDVVKDWQSALEIICNLGFKRILTSGQKPSALEGASVIREMIKQSAGRIEILPGGGIKLHNFAEVLRLTGCDQLHASLTAKCRDTSTLGNPDICFGGTVCMPEDVYSSTDTEAVKKLVKCG